MTKAYDTQTGAPVDVPEDQFAALFNAGKIGLPTGATVPIQGEDGIEHVAAENLADRLSKPGVTVVSQAAADAAKLQAEHGGALEQAKAGLEGIASGATLGLSDVAEGELLGNKEQIEARRKANPYTAGAGQLAGALLPSLLGAPEAEGAEAASLLGRGASAVGAPTRGLAAAGGAVEDAIRAGLGASESDSLVTALAKQVVAKGAGAAIEGAGYGAAQHLDESYLGDPNAAGESLLAAAGHGALLGLGVGGVLGAGGELGRAAFGRLAPHLSGLAERASIQHVGSAAIRELESLPGGARAAGRRLLDDEAIGVGDTLEQSAPKIAKAAHEADVRVGDLLDKASAAGAEGPEIETLLKRAGKDEAARSAIEAVAGVPSVEQAAAQGLDRDAMLFSARLSLSEARNLSRVPALRGLIDKDIDEAAGKAARRLGGGFLDDYNEAKLAADQYGIISKAVEKRIAAGESKAPIGVAAGIGLLTHGPLGAATGLALAVAKKQAAERGASTAAVVLDKLAALHGIERSVRQVDTQIGRGLTGAIPGAGVRAPVRVRTLAEPFEQRVEAVQRAMSDPGLAAQNATAGIDAHAPNVAKAFRSAAVRITQGLAARIPKSPRIPSITPQFDRPHVANALERASFNRAFDVAHDPMSVLKAAQDGTLTGDHVKALAEFYPSLYARVVQDAQNRLADLKHPLSTAQKRTLETLVGRPANATLTARYQKTYAMLAPPPPNPQQQQHANKAPKRPITAPARNAALDVGRPVGS